MDKKSFEVNEGPFRLDIFLSDALAITRSAAKKMIDKDLVKVNGKSAKASREVSSGDVVEADIPQPQKLDLTPQDIPFEIVYEDEDIAIINKPQGLTVHAGNGHWSGTLVNALLYRLKNLSSINGVIRPGIVHRIDKDTSGLLVVAKNDAAHLSLSEQIAQKTCTREYLALCDGLFKEDRGRVETFIGRSPSDRIKMAVVPEGKGKYAATNYEVVRRFAAGYTLVRFRLETGRTHQIRVHCRYLGHPVTGDPVYGSKKQKFNLNGQLLHACRLTLTHPRTGKRMTFEASLPVYFEEVLNKLEKGGVC